MHASFQQIVFHHPTSQDAPAQGSALRLKSAARDIPEFSRSRRRLQLHVEDPHEEQVMDIESPLAHASVQEAPNYIADLPSGPRSMCAVLGDVVTMAEKKTKSMRKIKKNLSAHCVVRSCIRGVPCEAVAKLVFADFPTSLGVAFIQEKSTPEWNVFSQSLPTACATIADLYVVNEGWYVTLSITGYFPWIFIPAAEKGFTQHQCLNVVVENGYIGHAPFNKIASLVLSLFHRDEYPNPALHSKRARKNYTAGIPEPGTNFIIDTPDTYSTIDDNFCRGGAKRSPKLCSFIVITSIFLNVIINPMCLALLHTYKLTPFRKRKYPLARK
ncbi:hypothetical protein O6H91_16G071400 [Diphasiastrum complanatum]|uniref:Uncharacterized protein n=1 Tax=Diphasiastrum complanatum TaxID=34168 RepID=A0ACC2BDQ7_DIPCM|nr:hypothetical protein O6H91_16G071400 [Diphasiastrum complanatum]